MTLDVDFGVFAPIALKDSDRSEFKWNVICQTVVSKSHAAGDFEITDEMLQAAVKNFKLRSTGKIPIKFDHHDPSHPAYDPRVGSPAQGYVHDMRHEPGKLWGLCEFKEPAKSYVLEEKYQWFSPGLSLDSLDRATGKRVGMRIREVSLVTDPHLYDMPAVRASNDERNALTETNKTDKNKESTMDENKVKELEAKIRDLSFELKAAEAKAKEIELEYKNRLAEKDVELSNKTKAYEKLVADVADGDVDYAIKTYGKSHDLSEEMRGDLKELRLSNSKLFNKLYPRKEASAVVTTPAKANLERPSYLTRDLSNENRPEPRTEERKLSQADLHAKYMKEGMDNTAAALRAAKECRLNNGITRT